MLKILRKYRHLMIIDLIYNINRLYQRLFTMMIKYKHGNQILEVYILGKYKDGNIK